MKTTIDDETLSVLKTVCVAGRAGSGFDQNSNARLEDLAEAGLIDLCTPAMPKRYYQPTAEGRALLLRLSEKGAA